MGDLRLNLSILILLGVANGTPILLKRILGDRFAVPIDFGLTWLDGQPLLGSSKTFRGLAVAIAATAIVAAMLKFGWRLGAEIAFMSMMGDVAASFLKRRLGLEPHARAFGLDQIPEALLPLVILRRPLGLSGLEIVLLVMAFILLEIWLSRLFFMLHIRDQPY
ncbi:CDP-archaeol synthase [Microvirga mediterraneensis]|uniref:CDP-archaeol synthase n=1 Tax=Microvirga mediterraneensis TaxID=2754695 RepID=A0A838BTX2_9HYPH|nr:CDP-archaeol synthase [Microvirga mediterraneensis]MBA1158808.1 CDP-archaeol synthase [Microvirga mediterraneensis]